MKRFITFFIVLIILFNVFAVEDNNQCFKSGVNNLRFNPITSMNSSDLSYLLFDNPSELSESRNRFNFPAVAIQVNHVSTLLTQLTNDDVMSVIQSFINKEELDYGKLIDAGYSILENYPGGITDLFKIDLATGFQKENLAISLNVEAGLTSETVDSGASLGKIISFSLMPHVTSALSVGYGRTICENEVFTINAGISLHGIQRLVTEKIDVIKGAEIVSLEKMDLNSILKSFKSDADFALTSDLSLSIGLTDKPFRFDFNLHNMPGTYKVKCYDSIFDMLNYESNGNKYSVYTPTTLSAYFVVDFIPLNFWDGRIKLYLRSGIDGFGPNNSDLRQLLDTKVCLNLFNTVECVVRNKAGYHQYGLSLNYHENRIDLLYGWHEEGKYLGDKPVDTFTLKMSLGFDK